MGKGFKERIAFEVIIILMALLFLCYITRLWPLVFLVIPGILIAALRMLFLSAKKEPGIPEAAAIPQQPHPDTEQDVIRIAFGILQHRITWQVNSHYPSSRWVWEAPSAIERFAEGMPLTILLNRAGGFRRAIIHVRNLQFFGLIYESAETVSLDEQPPETDIDGCPRQYGTPTDDEAVDYTLIAFQWVEANLLALNNRCNDTIAEGQATMLIPSCELPHPDSWLEVCDELTRNGFAGASVQEDGIHVELPE